MSGQNIDELLQDIVRMARASRDFYVATYATVAEPEMRTAFAFISDEKSRLVADLRPWLQTPLDLQRPSPASSVEKMYRAARESFAGGASANVAGALGFGEEQLLGLVERAFNETRRPALRHLLQSHRPQLAMCRQATWRLSERLAA